MLREVSLSDLEKEFKREDIAKLDAEGCKGCSFCCENVGRSILLDPYDIWQLRKGSGKSYEELLEEGYLEVHIADGLMIPNLGMRGKEGCGFLNDEKRCEIHSYRPGFCRLFPMARVFRDDGFHYIIQSDQCKKERSGEVLVSEWIGISDPESYDSFIYSWHQFRKKISDQIPGISMRNQKMLGRYILRKFYQEEYTSEDFFTEYEKRLEIASEAVKKLLH